MQQISLKTANQNKHQNKNFNKRKLKKYHCITLIHQPYILKLQKTWWKMIQN